MLRRIINRFQRELSDLHPRNRKWRRELARSDARFDAEHGVDTTPGDAIRNLTINSPNRRYSFGHIASQPDEFARSMTALAIRYEDFAFVDLGSGKGRALLLALQYPFRERIGVDFARELYEVAKSNLRGKAVKLICGDATEYDFPDAPLVVFLYNPFGQEIMAKVAARLRSHQSPLFIVYVNPLHLDPWTEQGFKVVTSGVPFVILAPDREPKSA
jgi:SAM-dependent methyltransferase